MFSADIVQILRESDRKDRSRVTVPFHIDGKFPKVSTKDNSLTTWGSSNRYKFKIILVIYDVLAASRSVRADGHPHLNQNGPLGGRSTKMLKTNVFDKRK